MAGYVKQDHAASSLHSRASWQPWSNRRQRTTCTSIVLALFLPVYLLLLKLGRRRRGEGSGAVRLPPGPWRLPVIGSLHHLIGNPLVHQVMADLARRLDAPLMYLRLGEVPVVVVTSPDAVREVMRTHDVALATRPWSPTVKFMVADGCGVIFAPYGDLWRQLRKICILELLNGRRVQSFRHAREEEVGRLVAAVAAAPPGEPVNVSERIAVLVTDSAVRTIIGDRFTRRDEFLDVLEKGVKLIAGFNLCDLFPSSRLASFVGGTTRLAKENQRRCSELMDYVLKQHKERRAAAAATANGAVGEDDDLVGVLLRIQKEGGLDVPLTTGIIKALILDLFGAGSETSATTLQWAMSELMRYPAVMRKAQDELRGALAGKPSVTEDDLADLKYLRLVVKETLRLHPPAPLLLPREAQETCRILGYDVPRGTTVFVNVWAMGRDPRIWGDAEEFRPERFEAGGAPDFRGMDFEYIPFGAGRRICPGMAFAQANIELALAALLYHFDWEIPGGVRPRDLDMAEEMGITVRRKNDLRLHAAVRVPAP